MNYSLILTFCLCCNFLIGQESKVIKLDEVSTFKNEVIDIIELNGQILYALNKPIDIYSKVEKGPYEGLDFLNRTYAIEFLNGTQFSFKKNEYLIYYDKDKIITTKNNIDEKLTIIKEYFVNHGNVKELKAIDIPYSESPIFYLKSVGKLLFTDQMEGGGYSYEIISMNNTKNKITITPFQTGYLESDELIMKDRIIFINQNAGNKEEIKTTIFNLETSEVMVEKLTDLGNFQYYKSFLIGKNILLSVYGNKAHASLKK